MSTSPAPSLLPPLPARNTVNRSDLVRYLSDSNTRVLAYHNHKEIAAWAAVAVLFTYSAVVVQCIDKGIGTKTSLTLVTLLVGSLSFWYVSEQLKLRREMSIFTFVLPRLAFQVLQKSDDEIVAMNWRMDDIHQNSFVTSPSVAMPAFIWEEYDVLKRLLNQSRRILEYLTCALIVVTIGTLVWVIQSAVKLH